MLWLANIPFHYFMPWTQICILKSWTQVNALDTNIYTLIMNAYVVWNILHINRKIVVVFVTTYQPSKKKITISLLHIYCRLWLCFICIWIHHKEISIDQMFPNVSASYGNAESLETQRKLGLALLPRKDLWAITKPRTRYKLAALRMAVFPLISGDGARTSRWTRQWQALTRHPIVRLSLMSLLSARPHCHTPGFLPLSQANVLHLTLRATPLSTL